MSCTSVCNLSGNKLVKMLLRDVRNTRIWSERPLSERACYNVYFINSGGIDVIDGIDPEPEVCCNNALKSPIKQDVLKSTV